MSVPSRQPTPCTVVFLLAQCWLGLVLLLARPALGADGAALYLHGVLPSGAPLTAQRSVGGAIMGPDAACVSCHRRSGLGNVEGRLRIPPIAGRYLFRPPGQSSNPEFRPELPGQPGAGSYDDASLARAIRDGVGRDGRTLSVLMPRYTLADADLSVLATYLRSLSASWAPGVSDDTLHFATVITPDADPAKRQAMLTVLESFFADKNAFIRGGSRPMHSGKGVPYRVTRKWALHVWHLTGEPSDWERQLERHMAAQPVFAIVSGLAGRTWAPVHRFCETRQVPCLFPNVDLPVVAEGDYYNLYFSKGVLLEAELLARPVRERQEGIARLIQVYREDDVGSQGAAALQQAAGAAIPVVMRPVSAGPQPLARAFDDVKPDDAMALWLRPADIKSLPTHFNGRLILVSGLMAELEDAPLPDSYRAKSLMAYPFNLPTQRKVAVDFPLGWFAVRKIPLSDTRMQLDTWLACRILAESLGDMGDNFYRDYLVEQTEDMLSRRLVNAYYPRLGMAPGQRFASKGGYLVRFNGKSLAAASDWTVP